MRTGWLPVALLLLSWSQTLVIRPPDRDFPKPRQHLFGALADLPLLMPTASLAPRRGLAGLALPLDDALQRCAPERKDARQHLVFYSFEVSHVQFLYPRE
jgi:hypothetical protein